jgi:putative effector of murein hydrolase LrgA (UPF0299 family)
VVNPLGIPGYTQVSPDLLSPEAVFAQAFRTLLQTFPSEVIKMEMMRQNTPELVSELSSLRIPRVIHNISKIIMEYIHVMNHSMLSTCDFVA